MTPSKEARAQSTSAMISQTTGERMKLILVWKSATPQEEDPTFNLADLNAVIAIMTIENPPLLVSINLPIN